jgi:predicted ATPase
LAVSFGGVGPADVALEALVEAEILQASPYDAEPRYEFRHALLQRMAYESMVQAERRGMHARIVDVLKRQSLPTVTEVIAHHLTEVEQFHDAIDEALLLTELES